MKTRLHLLTGFILGAVLLGSCPETGHWANAQTAPGASQTPKTQTISVNWQKNEGAVTARHYGVNLYAAFHEDNIQNQEYRQNLRYMGAGLIRFHHAGKMQDSKKEWAGLLDEEKRTWNREKLQQGLQAIRYLAGTEVVFNIPGFPAWMDTDKDGFLDKDQYDAYAKLLADLVRIVNKEYNFGVRYWEITNELDSRYYTPFYKDGGWGPLKDYQTPDRWKEVAFLFNRCARAMKQVDSTIQCGGPAAARPDLMAMHEEFIMRTRPYLDFYSFHAYASGSAETPDTEIYDRAQGMGNYVAKIKALLKRNYGEREVPVLLDEFNISWTWETRDPRMTNHKGAVFDALAIVSAIRGGVYATQSWNEKDGIYGKIAPDNSLRPGAHLLRLLTGEMTGERVTAKSPDEKTVVAYAVRRQNGQSGSVMLINRTATAQPAVIESAGLPEKAKWSTLHQIHEGTPLKTEAFDSGESPTIRQPRTLPPHSVTVLTWQIKP
ncbi:MAG: hypothetical protein OHK0029_09810 [Armatimonadaceae bacterium]